jgi:hypothetical protein
MHRILQPTIRDKNFIRPVFPPGPTWQDIFIRSEIVDADAVHALDKARPMDGEIILNSMEISPI